MNNAKKVIVIGGGFAGLSAATSLASRGFQVTVLEGRQVLGGRAYSFKDGQTGDSVDNGQHLFMGCYRETQVFLERIGALDNLHFQPNLSVDFIGDRSRHSRLFCWPLPSPFHLLSGLMSLSTLSWVDRFRLLYVQRALRKAVSDPQGLENMTVDQWLRKCHQSDRARRHLWDLIAIATLNENPSIASAAPFVTVLAQAFFERRRASRLGLSAVGLSDLYVVAAQQYLEQHGSQVWVKSPVAQLEIQNGRVGSVLLRDGTRIEADWFVSAVSANAFLKMIPKEWHDREPVFQRISQLQFSPIISIHLWFDREISQSAFAGLLDTQVQWFFNKAKIHKDGKKGAVSLVISGAHAFIEWADKRLLTLALEELKRLFPRAREANLLRSLVIKEHQATLSPTPGSEALRPPCQSPIENFLIAGDWTRTGLPATIESACLSGHACSNLIVGHEMEQPSSDSREAVYA